MRVLLSNPPWLRPGWYGVRAGSRWPHMERADAPYMPFPFLLGYAAAVLEQHGHEVHVIDACAERMGRDAFLDRVEAFDPDLFMAEISTPSLTEDLRTLGALRDRGYDKPIVLGGLHKPLYTPGFLAGAPFVQGTLVGEYELTLVELLRALETDERGPKDAIPGLIWRRGDELLDGGRKHSQEDLDSFPLPARHLFPMDRYHDLPGGIPAPSAQMWASRGCSFTCDFCAWPQILYADNLYRVRSADAVADEVVQLLDQGYASVYFDDDTFNLGKRRTADLIRAFTERGITAPWAFMGRADTCSPSQYEALAKTGLKAVKFGVESADTSRLKRIGKNLDVDAVRRSVAAAKANDVAIHLTFMFGLPGETLETMQRTLDLAYELDPDSAQFTIAVPFPGSRFYDQMIGEGRLAEGDVDFDALDGYRTGVVSTDALDAEQIISFVHGIHRRWDVRERPTSVAPIIPVAEIGGSGLSVGLLVRAGEGEWMQQAMRAVLEQEGPSRELVVVADRSDPSLEAAAAAVCDWATFLDADPGEPFSAMANRVAPACTGRWIALFHSGALPRAGWLESVLAAGKAQPDAGGFAVPLHPAPNTPGSDAPGTTGLSLSRWGRVLASDGGAVAAVASRAGVYARALLEDAGGFDPDLPAEVADADLGLRGLLLGYRLHTADGPGAEAGVGAVLTERGPMDDAAAERWARGRVRMLVKSLPREAWAEAGLPVALELAADLWRGARREPGRVPGLVRGFIGAGLGAREMLDERRKTLGRRRVGPDWVGEAFAGFEDDMAHCRWQRALRRLASEGTT